MIWKLPMAVWKMMAPRAKGFLKRGDRVHLDYMGKILTGKRGRPRIARMVEELVSDGKGGCHP